jgi:hypothetical protein
VYTERINETRLIERMKITLCSTGGAALTSLKALQKHQQMYKVLPGPGDSTPASGPK